MKKIKKDLGVISDTIDRARHIQDRRWDGPHSLEPNIDVLTSLLIKAFGISKSLKPSPKLFDVVLILEESGLFREGISDLVAELEFELEDVYSDDDEFESEYVYDVCEFIIEECEKHQ